jgi:hypothetical protein
MAKEKYNPYVEDLRNFIKHNSLSFKEGRRNSDLVMLCGYSLHTGAEKEDVETVLHENFKTDAGVEEEFNRVYPYVKKNNYGDWWINPRNNDAINAYTPPD